MQGSAAIETTNPQSSREPEFTFGHSESSTCANRHLLWLGAVTVTLAPEGPVVSLEIEGNDI
jgi:hypothetical protein